MKTTDPGGAKPKGSPEAKAPAVKVAPLVKVMDPGSAAVSLCAVAAVEDEVIWPAMMPFAPVPTARVMALVPFRCMAHPVGTSRSVPAPPAMVKTTAASLCRITVVLFEMISFPIV